MSHSARCIRTLVRDDGTELDVAFDFSPGQPESGRHGPPEDYDPGSGPEVFVVKAVPRADPDGEPVRLDDEEEARFADETLEDPDFEPFPERDA